VKTSLRRMLRAHAKTRGLLIALDGPDGAGKTTQRRLLKTWLLQHGHRVHISQPAASGAIRPLLKARQRIHALDSREFCLLRAAAFRHRLETDILPAVSEGKTVIADGLLLSEIARATSRGLDLDWVLEVYAPLIWPDLSLYFAVSPDTSTTRVAAGRVPSFYQAAQEATNIADPVASYRHYVARARKEFDACARIFDVETVNAEAPIYQQHLRVRGLVQHARRRDWADKNADAVGEWLAQSTASGGTR
jgi:dTMP kinase